MENEIPQDIVELKASAPAVVIQARNIAAGIATLADIERAGDWCSARKAEVDTVISRLERGKRAAKAAHEEWCSLEREATNPRVQGIAIVKDAIGSAYLEIARKQREADAAALADAAKKDEELRAKQAAKLKKQGHEPLAEAIMEGAGDFVAPPKEVIKPDNVSVTMAWAVEVTSLRELILWVNSRGNMDGEDKALLPNTEWLTMRAKMSDGNAKVDGVRFFRKPRVALKSA